MIRKINIDYNMIYSDVVHNELYNYTDKSLNYNDDATAYSKNNLAVKVQVFETDNKILIIVIPQLRLNRAIHQIG